MSSRFLQLFKRGRYVSVRSLASAEADDAGREKKHQERERFSVAAVAFCLEHDQAFKNHFLKTISKDFALSPTDIDTVTLEPEHWGDLILEGKQHILVLEFKLGALLQEHQSPEARIFSEKGYGAKIREHFPARIEKERRYIVIGKEFLPIELEGLKCSAIPWRNFVDTPGREESSMETDLYDCLGYLGVPVFLNRNMKNQKLAGDAHQAMKLCGTLQQVLDALGLPALKLVFYSEYCGIEIRSAQKPTPKSLHAGLIKLVKPQKKPLGWIGYDLVEGKVFLSVWFYSTRKTAPEVLKRLSGMKGLGPIEPDGHVVLRLPGEESNDDAKWFKQVLETAGNGSSK
jgi:hypothetical protein